MSESTHPVGLDVADVIPADAVVTVHEPDEPAVAAALDANGIIIGLEVIDAAAHPEREGITYRILNTEERALAVPGARWTGSTWEPPTAAAPTPVASSSDGALDALVRLVLRSQAGGHGDDLGFAAVLADMAGRGALDEATVDGALAWGVIDSDDRASLLERIGAPAAPPEDAG